jgi:hypothetical protein
MPRAAIVVAGLVSLLLASAVSACGAADASDAGQTYAVVTEDSAADNGRLELVRDGRTVKLLATTEWTVDEVSWSADRSWLAWSVSAADQVFVGKSRRQPQVGAGVSRRTVRLGAARTPTRGRRPRHRSATRRGRHLPGVVQQWSPSGLIVYTRTSTDDPHCSDLLVGSAFRGTPRSLVSNTWCSSGLGGSVLFSPDGRRALSESDVPDPVYELVDLGSGKPETSFHLPGYAYARFWSPDGRIGFIDRRGGERLMTVAVDGRTPRTLMTLR